MLYWLELGLGAREIIPKSACARWCTLANELGLVQDVG